MSEKRVNQRVVRKVRQDSKVIQNKKVKQWTKVWWKWMLIWMWIFVFVLIFLIFAFFFYLTSNPSAAKWLGIWPSTIKSITSVFAWLVFWSLFVVFLIMWLSYLYKLSTKTENRTKNIVWTVVVFILWITNILLWWIVYSRIMKIKTDDYINTTDVLIAKVNYLTHDLKEEYIPLYNNTFPLIAPIKINFDLNVWLYKNRERIEIVKKNWAIQEQKFVLDCWNGQILEFYPNNSFKFPLNKYCLYLKKSPKWKPYKIKFKLIYNTNTEKNKVYQFADKEIYVDTNITFKTKTFLNDSKNELIVWERWDEIQMDISKLPEDLSLESNSIWVKFEKNGNFQNYEWFVKYIYHDDGLHNIVIRIPWVEQAPYYYFPVRVRASTKPICNIEVTDRWNNVYDFKIKWEKADAEIAKYLYKLVNLTEWNTVKTWKSNRYKTTLKNWYVYQMEAIVVDSKKKKWKCKSELIDLTNRINYKFDILVNWKRIDKNKIEVSKLPMNYKLEIKNIKNSKNNSIDNLDIWFDLDWDFEIDEKWNEYSFKKEDKKEKTINLIVKDSYWNQTIKSIIFEVKLKPIIWGLKLSKEEWEVPLTVEFDASASEVTNEDDKIVYFNWDFWDGKLNENTRQWIVTHTYKKFGKYIAKVNIITKKWKQITLERQIDVYKPINSARILFPNNLWWQWVVQEPLKILLNTSGSIKDINWKFGDWEVLSCEGRECTSVSHIYKKTWRYKVSAKISYTDGSPIVSVWATIYIWQ